MVLLNQFCDNLYWAWHKITCNTVFYLHVACVASVSVEFGSKERPRNEVFGILPARKMGREPKKERWG